MTKMSATVVCVKCPCLDKLVSLVEDCYNCFKLDDLILQNEVVIGVQCNSEK